MLTPPTCAPSIKNNQSQERKKRKLNEIEVAKIDTHDDAGEDDETTVTNSKTGEYMEPGVIRKKNHIHIKVYSYM